MRNLLLLFLLLMSASAATAGDSTSVSINKSSFSAHDTIEFSCRIPDYSAKGLAAVTLNVWIQDVESKQTWKFRYPVLNGTVDCALAIGDSIPPGKYAMNFILQRGLFRINGTLKNNFSHSSLNYMMLAKGRPGVFNNVSLDPTGAFTLKNILFQDNAFFVFTPAKKLKQNDLFINVTTPLDSAFIPVAIYTQLIDVKPELIKTPQHTPPYNFDFAKTFINTTLPDVVVTYKGKKKVEQYDDTYSTGLFKTGGDARIFDGLDDDEISSSIDIPSFLQRKIPGLKVETDNNNRMIWRNEPVVVYVDEYKLEDGEDIFITPSEVAMIKVFDPPAFVNSGSSFGGAVAIYTKKGNYENNTTRKYKFTFKGYTGIESVWR